MRYLYVYLLFFMTFVFSAFGIRDESNQERWETPSNNGPDAVVPGFLINLGPTGGRAILTANTFVVKYIFKSSPAAGQLKLNDVITGANGKPFSTHTFGGTKNLGIEGPIYDMGMAIEDSEGSDGQLTLQVTRGGVKKDVVIQLEKLGRFSATFPENCAKAKLLHKRALDYLTKNTSGFGPDGSCAAALALMSSEHKNHQQAGKSIIQKYRSPGAGTWTWSLSFQSIALAEYYLLTQDNSVLGVLKECLVLLRKAQYKGPNIRKWKAKEGESQKLIDEHSQLYAGGFGHGPFINGSLNKGYGPMQPTTILAVIAMQLGKDCGIEVKHEGLKTAFQFMNYGTNDGGNVAYGGEFTLNNGPIDSVRWKSSTQRGNAQKSGMSIIAYNLSPGYEKSVSYLKLHKENIHECFKGMGNGHADGTMAMTWGLLGVGASEDGQLKRKVFDYFKIMFNMNRCHGSENYVALPGRDYADGAYYRDNRSKVTAMAALLYSFYNPKLQVHGVQVAIPGVNHRILSPALSQVYMQISEGKYGLAAKQLSEKSNAANSVEDKMLKYIERKAKNQVKTLEEELFSGHWLEVETSYMGLKDYWQGVPLFDSHFSNFQSFLAAVEGQALLKADIAYHEKKYGLSFKMATTAASSKTAQIGEAANKVLTRLNKEVDAFALKIRYMEARGEWYNLWGELKGIKGTYRGIAKIDTLHAKLADPFKTPSGKALYMVHKNILDGKFAAAYKSTLAITAKATVDRHKKIASILGKKIEKSTALRVGELQKLLSSGAWHTLYGQLVKDKKLYVGITEFNTFYAKNMALIKSSVGRIIVASEKLQNTGKLSMATKALNKILSSPKVPEESKAIAEKVIKNINNLVQPRINDLLKLEELGDWYALQQNLSSASRDLSGIGIFDDNKKRWLEKFRQKEVNVAINAGKEFLTLKKSWSRGPSDNRRKQIKKFIEKNKDNFYGQQAEKLIGV
jgi:hypothetical protein